MNVHANDRAAADTDPSTESWLYRSEAFAEDLEDAAPTLLATRPATTAAGPHRAARSRPWSAALSGRWLARAQAAR
jgi:hypothetical protein